ncbi:uncharacterized protein LOC135581776 isoform X1 [Musa acuminata AAA Group]|uniref:uncharacterized protein LOC135581776 isoform X1 n=2 Tax=Musa acuminata AAA Group TaxID=214697 RepID=UPI0031CF3908
MEHSVGTVIDTVGSDEKGDKENNDNKTCDSEPVVYQLVRVEGDGRLVPATDDEVMEVEQLLEGEKREVKAIRNDKGCLSGEVFSKSDLEGIIQSGNANDSKKLNARLENIKVMLQKVKQEEQLLLSGESFNHSPKCTTIEDPASERCKNSKACNNKLQPEITSREIMPRSLELNSIHDFEVGSAETCSGPTNEAVSSKSSISESCTSLFPEFSILRGEICLDNFSIRELQEAFRTTFGRQTSVKDKLWLKRRIAMGLTNSCHVPSASFTIKDNKIILSESKEGEPERLQQSKNEAESLSMNIHVINASPQDFKTSLNSNMTDQQLSGKRLGLSPSNHDVNDENCQMEHCAVKRMRKPTKRYIEELSELETRECTAKSYSCVKISEHSHFPSKRQIKPVRDGKTQRRIFSTRHISVGGFSFEVPYVLRTRRRQPRKNFVDLMEYNPATISHMVKTAVMIPALEEGSGNGSRSREIVSVPMQILQLSVAGEGDVKMNTKTLNCEEDLDLHHKGLDANGDTTYGNANTQPAPKGSARRKHHRAWTLCEVRKLVDGVAKYGAGRWSEIRRLAFASYSYRTSVDLKDKWRNLLRASLAQYPTKKEAKNFGKQTSVPIPTPILSQVRELAKLQTQTGIKPSPKKFAGRGGRPLQGEGSGFL